MLQLIQRIREIPFIVPRPNRLLGKNVPCEVCGELIWCNPYKINNQEHFFCSRLCKGKWQSLNSIGEYSSHYKGGRHIPCEVCGKLKWVGPQQERLSKRFFCSTSCMGQWFSKNKTGKNHPNWSQVEIECNYCNKLFSQPNWYFKGNDHHFCSPECTSKWRSERMLKEKHFAWNGGTSNDPYSFGWEEISKRIRERDSYICQNCGKFGNHVHHIDRDRKNDNDDNLITLCPSCHGGVKKIEFLS